MRKLLLLTAAIAAFTVSAQTVELETVFAELPEVLAVAFDVPVTKQEMLEYCRKHPESVPEWLPEPYRAPQAANFARSFIDSRELNLGAERNGFTPTVERAEKYLEKKLSATEPNAWREKSAASGLTRDAYIEQEAADPDVRLEAASDDFLEMLAAQHRVGENEIVEYFQTQLPRFQPNESEFVNYAMLNPDGSAITGSETAGVLTDRAQIPVELLEVLDKMNRGETSAPVEYEGRSVILKKFPFDKPELTASRRELMRQELVQQKAGDPLETLHLMSKVKYNFEIPEIPMFF